MHVEITSNNRTTQRKSYILITTVVVATLVIASSEQIFDFVPNGRTSTLRLVLSVTYCITQKRKGLKIKPDVSCTNVKKME